MPRVGVTGSHLIAQGSRWTWRRVGLGQPPWAISFHTSKQRSLAGHVWNQGLGWAPTQASDDVNLQPSGGGAATAQVLAPVFSFPDPSSWMITMNHKLGVTRHHRSQFVHMQLSHFTTGMKKRNQNLLRLFLGFT